MEQYAEVTRFRAEARGRSSWVDFVTIGTDEGGFQVPYDVAKITLGIELKPGETKSFRVPHWIEEARPEEKEIGG